MIVKVQRPLVSTMKDAAFLIYDKTKRCMITVSMSDAEVAPVLFMLFFRAHDDLCFDGDPDIRDLNETPLKIYVDLALDENKMLLIDEDAEIVEEQDW